MITPLVTIIMPIYNRSKLIHETVWSLKKQIYKNFECLMIDDHSTDDTFEILKSISENDSRFKALLRDENYSKGPSGCRNMGLDLSKGKYIQFFDSDDLMTNNHLFNKVNAYETLDSDLVICKLVEFKEQIEHTYNINSIDDKNDIIKHISGETNYYLPCPMWKKEIIDKTRFIEKIKIYEDLIFNLTNRKKCKKVFLINEVNIYYRRHETSTTGMEAHNLKILENKIDAWKYLLSLFTNNEQKLVKKYLFKYSCLNLYYIFCKKSIFLSFKQIRSLFEYISDIKSFFFLLKLIFLSPIVIVSSKGYKFFKVKI